MPIRDYYDRKGEEGKVITLPSRKSSCLFRLSSHIAIGIPGPRRDIKTGYFEKRCDITRPDMTLTLLPIVPEANFGETRPLTRFVRDALVSLDKVTDPGLPGKFFRPA